GVGLEVDDAGELADRDGGPAVTADPRRAVGQLDVGGAGLEQARGDLAQLAGHQVGGAGGGAAADHDRAAGERPPAIGGEVGVPRANPIPSGCPPVRVAAVCGNRGPVPLPGPAGAGGTVALTGRALANLAV